MEHVSAPEGTSSRQLLDGLRVQGSVIGALIMRELHTRYGRRGLGYVWLILEPMLLASLVVSIKLFARDRHYGVGIDVVPFIVLGYTMFIMFRGIWNRADTAIEANLPLMYHRMVTIFDILLSRALLDAVASITAFIVLMGLCLLLEMAHPPARPLYFITGFVELFWFSFALSMIICGMTYENTTLQKFVHPISYILMPLSGAFYMVKWFPHNYHGLVSYWPMASMFEEMRYGWFAAAPDDYFFPGYVSAICLILTMIGLLSIRVVRRKVELK